MMSIPVKMTFTREGVELSKECAEVPPEAILDALADVVEVILNA